MTSLVSFPAGRASRVGTTSTVQPEEGRGLISLASQDDLLHFTYTDLASGATVDDLILFPGDAQLDLLPGRVAVLRFLSSSARHFYWFQDVDSAQDQEHVTRVNSIIASEEDHDVEIDASSASLAAPAENNPIGSTAQMQSLQQLIDSLASGGGASTARTGADFSLSSILTSSVLAPLLSNPQHLASLAPYLASSLPPTSATLQRTVESPEFKRSVASFDRALRTGALGPLLAELGMTEADARGVAEYLAGVQRTADETMDTE